MGPLLRCKQHMLKPHPPSLSPELLPAPDRSTENTSSLFRHFQASVTHLQKSETPKNNICSTNPSPPAGLMSPWTPRMRTAGHDAAQTPTAHHWEYPEKKKQFTSRFSYNSSRTKMGGRKLSAILIHFQHICLLSLNRSIRLTEL